MIGRALLILTVTYNCVLTLPITSSHLKNEDVKVMKCIVEVLADVLSRPHPLPVNQECLSLLRTDDRLVSILRHHSFLKELQEVVVQGSNERAQLNDDITVSGSDHVTQTPENAEDADRSMLEALGGPGERAILSQTKRTGLSEDEEEQEEEAEKHEESREAGAIGGAVRGNQERDDAPPADKGSGEKTDQKKDEGDEEEDSEEENVTNEKRGDEPDGKTEHKKSDEDDEEGQKRADDTQQQEEEVAEEREQEGEVKKESKESVKRWSKMAKGSPVKKAPEEAAPPRKETPPHHSKEVAEEEEEEVKEAKEGGAWRSPEEKGLQAIAGKVPELRRGLEEEGSASRRSEEPEIESLAAIETELENVAQKLHELRRG